MSLYFLSRSTQALARRIGEAARAPAPAIDPIDRPAFERVKELACGVGGDSLWRRDGVIR